MLPKLTRSTRAPVKPAYFGAAVLVLSVFENLIIWDIPILRTPPAIAAGLLLFVFLLAYGSTYSVQRGPEVWVLLFGVASATAYALQLVFEPSLDFSDQVRSLLSWIQPIILFLMLLYLVRKKDSFRFLWLSFLAGALLMVVLGLGLPGHTGDLVDGSRDGYQGVNLNRQAFVYAVFGLALLAWTVENWHRSMTLAVMAFTLMLLVMGALIATGSRAGFGSFIVGALVVFLISLGQGRVLAKCLAVVVVSAIGLMAFKGDHVLWERFVAIGQAGDLGTRDVILPAAWSLFLDRPILGYGSTASAALGDVIYGGGRAIDAHNAHFQILLRVGIVPYGFWLLLMISSVRLAWLMRGDPVGRLTLGVLAAMFVFSITGSLVTSLYYWIVTACLVGHLLRLRSPRHGLVAHAGSDTGGHTV